MNTSEQLLARAQAVIPGGVNSPVRAFNGVGGCPAFIERAEGAYLYDADGQRYIDYVGSWGPMILGHQHPAILSAISEQLNRGVSFGAPTAIEAEMAELVCELVPSLEQVRMVNSGTEATMTALRLARGITGRDNILKFAGCYHGHADSLLVNAGSGALTLGIPSSPGVPEAVAAHTWTLPYNDIAALEQLFAERGHELAGVIVEPVAGNMNCVPPKAGFLEALRRLCDEHGSLLIFDEVMTGFRVALGGAQAHFNISPDLTTLGKVIGGGLPVGALGGKREYMSQLAPAGPVYQAGTLSGNPLAMQAGLACLRVLQNEQPHAQLTENTSQLLRGLEAAAAKHDVRFCTSQVGAMFGLYIGLDEVPANLDEVQKGDIEGFKRFFHAMLKQGVYLAPSAYEAGFVSTAHSAEDIAATCAAAELAFAELK